MQITTKAEYQAAISKRDSLAAHLNWADAIGDWGLADATQAELDVVAAAIRAFEGKEEPTDHIW